jgi:hypothetical protein
VAATMMATHAIMTELTSEIENVGRRLFTNNFLSFFEIYNDLFSNTVNAVVL